MDPLTILAAAQAAYGGIQAAIAAGKEIQSMAADLSELWGSVAKLTSLAADPPKITYNIFSKKTPEQIAIERYTAKAEANDLAAKAKNMFVGQYGLAAWDQIQKEVINIRKEIERQRYEEEKAKAEKLDEIREAGVILLIVLGSLVAIAIVGSMLFGGHL